MLKKTRKGIKQVKEHEKIGRVLVSFGNASKKVTYNFKENLDNWKNRTLEDHGFKIEEEDI